MKYKKEIEEDNLVKLRLVTSDNKLNSLITYLEKNIPKTIQQAQDEYIKNQQSFVCFMEQMIVCTKDEKDKIERADFYHNYTEFCKDNNINIVLKKKEIFEMADKIFGKPIKDNTLKYQFCKYTDE
jgi:hypothetical protein